MLSGCGRSLRQGKEGAEDYVALIESEVVARFIARKWQARGTQLIPPSAADQARMDLFVASFMESLANLSFSFLGAKSADQVTSGYEKLLNGLVTIDNALRSLGNEKDGSFLFGAQYTLAEALTAPFVIRLVRSL